MTFLGSSSLSLFSLAWSILTAIVITDAHPCHRVAIRASNRGVVVLPRSSAVVEEWSAATFFPRHRRILRVGPSFVDRR
jgi:hypothetical protein